MSKHLTHDDIKVKPGIQHIRKRPSMYIGSTGATGALNLIRELVEWAVSEAESSVALEFCDRTITIAHDGPSISVERHPTTYKTILEAMTTELGTGPSPRAEFVITSALSERFTIETSYDDRLGNFTNYLLEVKRGVAQSGPQATGPASKSGVKISFKLDPEIFGEEFPSEEDLCSMVERIRQDHPAIEIVESVT